MKNRTLKTLTLLGLILVMSCSKNKTTIENKKAEVATQKEVEKTQTQEPHEYGGWYCPDNLRGFPAVDIKDWKQVPVVNGRLATEEETKNGILLILLSVV